MIPLIVSELNRRNIKRLRISPIATRLECGKISPEIFLVFGVAYGMRNMGEMHSLLIFWHIAFDGHPSEDLSTVEPV